MASLLSFVSDFFWPQVAVAPAPALKEAKVEPEGKVEAEDPLPYLPSGHDHTARCGCPRRRMPTLVKMARAGHLHTEEECWIQVPNSPKRAYYTLRLLGDPYDFAFYAGKPELNGSLVGCHPDHVVKDFYNDQKRMAGWCAIHLSRYGDIPLCQFYDQHVE